MANSSKRWKSSDEKLSATFLDFAAPLVDAIGPEVSRSQLEAILRIAFLSWNAVVLDMTRADSRHLDSIRQLAAEDPLVAGLAEHMLARKRIEFGDDERLIGHYELREDGGVLILRAEAVQPKTGAGQAQAGT